MTQPSNYLLGYIVLEARKRPVFPLMPFTAPSQHIDGSSNGSGAVVCKASAEHVFFQPDLGKKLTFFASRGYADYEEAKELMKLHSTIQQTQDGDSSARQVAELLFPHLQPNSLVFLDQEKPYGSTIVLTSGVEMRLFGVYTPDFALLAVTNLQNFEDLLHKHHPSEFWLHRFLPRDTAHFIVFTKRVCARWFRWKSQDNLTSTAARFVALERLLFKE